MKRTAKKPGKIAPAFLQSFNFNSIAELIQTTEQEAETSTGAKNLFNRFYVNENTDRDWTGGLSGISEYKELLKNGYLPAVEQLAANQTNSGTRFDLVPSVSGEFFDIGAYIEGRPECMGDFTQQEVNQYLTVLIECSVGYKVNGELLMGKAKTIFNCINEIEAKGTRVKIVLFSECTAEETNQKFNIYVNVKAHEENFIPSWHGLLIGHLATVRAVMYSYLSIKSLQDSIASKDVRSKPEPGTVVIELTDSETEIKRKLTQGSGTL